ncbi:MAG TPA: LPS export ABC transporter periplasmic protein LptC [Chitinophagaceae bacterium]|nr:LPS export ABC transporter periplasmic protein LptC [Chitinophagaceae bacterium]
MNKRIRTYFILAAFLTGCFFLSNCENDIKEIQKLSEKKTAVEEAYKVETFMSQDARIKARLTAPYMLRYLADSPYVEFPRSLHVDFYNDTMAMESQVDALYGKYREWERMVYLRDSVVVMNKLKGDTMRTSELWWNQQTEKFYTDKPVRIHTKDRIFYGAHGLEAAQNFEWWVLNSGSGRVIVPKDSLP